MTTAHRIHRYGSTADELNTSLLIGQQLILGTNAGPDALVRAGAVGWLDHFPHVNPPTVETIDDDTVCLTIENVALGVHGTIDHFEDAPDGLYAHIAGIAGIDGDLPRPDCYTESNTIRFPLDDTSWICVPDN